MDAGSVVATLGGRFSPGGFDAFGSAMYRARSQMEAGEKRMTSSQARVSKSLHNMGQAAKYSAVGGIAGLGVVIGYSIKKAADFEQQLDSLASTSGASGRQMQQFKKQAMDAGAATKYSALEAAQAQTELSKGGLSVTNIMKGGLKGALALASAGELDLADASKYTVNALKLFKMGGDQATHVADALATAANTTTADVQDFGMALTQGGGAAKSAGYSFDQTVTILEALAEVGVKNSDAGTSMKAALLQLVGPTKKQAEASKKAGLSFLDQHGSMKSVTAISEMLRAKTGDMTKAQRTALFQTLAGTDGFRTLLALYDAGPAKLSKLEQANKRQGVAAQVSAEKQDNLKGKWENFTGSIETAAIVIGDKFLPLLTQGATAATDFLNHLSSTGQLDSFANGLVIGTREAIAVVGDLAHVVGDVGHAAAPVAGILLDIGHALDLGDPTHIEAILAAIIGFKVAGVIAPMVVSLAEGIALLSTAPTIGALGADLLAMVNPITAAAVGVGLLAGALVLLSGKETADARAARESAAAHKAQAEAIRSVRDAERAAADKGLAAQQSSIDEDRAKAATRAAAKGPGGKSSAAYKEALIAERQAILRAKDAHDAYNTSIDHQNKSNQKSIDKAKDRVAATNKEVDAARRQVAASSSPIKTVGGQTIQRAPRTGDVEAAKLAQERQTEAVQAYIQAVARANVSDDSRKRLMHGASQITEENVQGISHLIDAMDGLPTKKQTTFLLTGSQAALSTLGSLAAQLTAMGRKRTVTRVLANANSANAAVLGFKAILAGVPLSKVAHVLATTKGKEEVAQLKALIDNTNSKYV
ncbi:MAG: Phage-related tail protein, partial [Frankiales bacterium]|nr:Phage-related tail protein [Frankiales bacterium]